MNPKANPSRSAGKWRFQAAYALLFLAALMSSWRLTQLTQNKEAGSLPTGGKTELPDLGQTSASPTRENHSTNHLDRLRTLTTALRSNLGTDKAARGARLASLLALADERAALMRKLMAEDPRQALAFSLSFAEYAALPAEVRKQVERPFSLKGDFVALPLCPDAKSASGRRPGLATATYEVQAEGAAESWRSYVESRREGLGTKLGIPLQGFELSGQAVIRDEVMQVLDSRDAEAARQTFGMTVANSDPGRDFLTGERIVAEPVTAAAGGRLYLFTHRTNVDRLNGELAEMERKPGPHSGSQVLFHAMAMAAVGASGGGFDLAQAWEVADFAADSWTETKKKIYVIRIDFPDLTGEAISKPLIEAVFNTTVSNQVFNMSYGKTWSEATASPMVVRMPSGTSVYTGEGTTLLLHSNAVTAFNALATGVNLANYDIVCVACKSIGMTANGTTFGGLAAGDRMWLQNSFQSTTVTHELGHNYGLGHASFWQTTDGSVVGVGSRIEYGDDFDIMGGGPIPEGHYHMQGKSSLNWLTTNQWTTVSGSGTYRIYRIDDRNTTASFSRGLRIARAASPVEYYWVGYRRAFSSNPYLANGAYLLWQRPGEIRCDLLDTTPDSAGGKSDCAILIGRTYSDPVANVHITPTANGGAGSDEWLDVTVNIAPSAANRPPVISALSGPTNLAARTSATFTATASDPDGDSLAYTWDFGDGLQVLNTASVTHTWGAGGTYTVRVTASDMKGQVVSKTLLVNVADPLLLWTAQNSRTTADLQDICAGTNGAGLPIVLAVGLSNNFDAKICISTNGADWTSGPLGEANVSLNSVLYDGHRFIACGWFYSFTLNDRVGGIWTSVDGAPNNWTHVYSSTNVNSILEGIAVNGQTIVAVGESGIIVYSSNGGTTWATAATTATRHFYGVAFGAGQFLAVGGNDNGTLVQVFTSPNGSQWTETTATSGLETWQTLKKVKYFKDRFVACGWASKIRYSTDAGVSFQTTRPITEETPAFAFGNGLFFAAGEDRDHANADINLVSTDGATWFPITTLAQNTRNAAAFFKDTFITVGNAGAIWQSGIITPPLTTPPPSATTLAAAGVSGTAATLNGSGNPNGSAAIAFFQWGTSVSYGQTTAAVNLGNGSAAIPLSTPIVGLTAGQTYHFRAVASNSFGVAFGSDLTFTTPGGQFTITPSGHNVILSWPAGLRAALQETRRLAPASWTYSTSGTNHPVTIPVTNTASLYRLVLAPPNDDFANRTALSGAPSTVTALNAAASTETGEPPNANNGGGRSVWWSWTAPSNGSVTISTVGSDFDTLLSVYTGTALNALVLVSASDDIQPGNPQSQVTFTATQNVTYLISVDGYNRGTGAAFGTIKLNLTRP